MSPFAVAYHPLDGILNLCTKFKVLNFTMSPYPNLRSGSHNIKDVHVILTRPLWANSSFIIVSICHGQPVYQIPFKRNRLRCVNENRKKRKRLRWKAANHGCHCFDLAFLLVGSCVCCMKISRNKRKRQPIGMLGRSSGKLAP